MLLQESHIKQSAIEMLSDREMDTDTLGKYQPKDIRPIRN